MAKRNEIRICRTPGCSQEAAPRRQWCEECWLDRQPPVIRAEAAQRRRNLVPEPYRVATVHKTQWPEGRRWCAGCQTFVRLKDTSGSRCRACASIARHKSTLRTKFGTDDETYQWLLMKQKGRCAICRARPKTVRLALDHDHKHCKDGCPECFRGLLCARCNHELLGAAHDSLNILRNAVVYLETPPFGDEWDIPAWEREEWEAKYGKDAEPAPF